MFALTRTPLVACKLTQLYSKHIPFLCTGYSRANRCSVAREATPPTPRRQHTLRTHSAAGLLTFGCACVLCVASWAHAGKKFASDMADNDKPSKEKTAKDEDESGPRPTSDKPSKKKIVKEEEELAKRHTREGVILKERERYINMKLPEKRKLYKCGRNYKTLDHIKTWPEYHQDMDCQENPSKKYKGKPQKRGPLPRKPLEDVDETLNSKVSLWRGDITQLEIDGIVNAANGSLLGGGGVDGAIHSAAGKMLRKENQMHNGCDTGEAKISAGYSLPAKYVISTVGPIGEKQDKLRSCYKESLQLVKEHGLRHVAFPCISTGIYGYPNDNAAEVALQTVRKWLDTEDNAKNVDRVIFCLFLPVDVMLYETLMPVYFPLPPTPHGTAESGGEEETSFIEPDDEGASCQDTVAQTKDTKAEGAIVKEETTSDDEIHKSEKATKKEGDESKPAEEISEENLKTEPGKEPDASGEEASSEVEKPVSHEVEEPTEPMSANDSPVEKTLSDVPASQTENIVTEHSNL